ncbi:hypothetical protein [Syntrophobacter fumaroxidans]|uniref:hypothetical protein n=1 Tax=Syntrophobacter fumaroxidans TaxID=119484 RepID=UPI0002E4DF01|nr:hypothetical protein [Syntrophobacter fumaroxidans]
MNRLTRTLGRVCNDCPLCRYARENPATLVGKLMNWHGKWCPAWKAQKLIAREQARNATDRPS